MTTTWLDEIGLAYSKNFDEVEGARAEFARQRTDILDHLVRVCTASLTERGCKFERGKVEDGWETFWLKGDYSAVRKEAGRAGDREAAICFGLDHDPSFRANGGDRFGFGVYLLFKMSIRRFNQLRVPLASAGFPVDHYGEDAAAYLRSYWATPGDDGFALKAFEQAVAIVPALYSQADSVLGPAFRKVKFGE